jgi:hypothetical protein
MDLDPNLIGLAGMAQRNKMIQLQQQALQQGSKEAKRQRNLEIRKTLPPIIRDKLNKQEQLRGLIPGSLSSNPNDIVT